MLLRIYVFWDVVLSPGDGLLRLKKCFYLQESRSSRKSRKIPLGLSDSEDEVTRKNLRLKTKITKSLWIAETESWNHKKQECQLLDFAVWVLLKKTGSFECFAYTSILSTTNVTVVL